MRRAAILTLVAVATATTALAATPGPHLPPPRAALVDCDDSAGAAVIPRGARSANHFHIQSPQELGSHYNPAAGRYTGKFPAAVSGHREVTVSVPPRLRGRLRISYGGSGLSTEIAFTPCSAKPATFFPGGVVFKKLEPLSLKVTIEGSDTVRHLRLGVIPPRHLAS